MWRDADCWTPAIWKFPLPARRWVVDLLPMIRKDPFDRMLFAQAIAGDITLVTSDPLVARYPGPICLACSTRSP